MRARPAPGADAPVGDPLSDVLALLQIRDGTSLRIAAGGAWALRLPSYSYLKFIAQVAGRQWIRVDGGDTAICLEPGDCLVMHGGRPFVVASDLALAPVDGVAHFAAAMDRASGSVRWGEGAPDMVAVAGRFEIAPGQRALLDEILPPELHIRAASRAAPALRALLELFRDEAQAGAPGQRAVTAGLARIALVQALRAHGEGPAADGWLGALADPRIGPVLRALHGDPARRWTLPELARAGGMSRSALALRFKALVGSAPLHYLQQWRMRLARQALVQGSEPVATLAYRLGYASESAFSAAFKKSTGLAPGQFRQQGTAAGLTR
ncbi:AraC family transcriptional regulator [Massilia sp. TN1-12]|uniref:AraC family transcriptional regulator n=1 Tax=Massilia paldalensis TaxID=3377675 RepID=UPI0038515DF3